MRARVAGLCEKFRLLPSERSVSTFASTSRIARPPQSILEWQHQLSLPSTSSHYPLFSKLHEAIQAPFPPLKEPYAWIEARDVDKTLKRYLSGELDHKAQEQKAKLDAIIRGINRCTENAKERIGYHIEQEFQRYGVHLSPEERSAKVSSHPSVRAWEKLQSSHNVKRTRLTLSSHSLRNPSREDLLEALEFLDTLTAGSPSLKELDYFNRLLALIARQMPTLDDSSKVKRFLEYDVLPNQLQLDVSGVYDSPKSIRNLIEMVRSDDDGTDMDLPHIALLLFQGIWNLMKERCRPNFAAYGIAVVLETKLAPFRSISPRSADIWGPVERLKRTIHEKDLLRTSHVNQIMWAILRYDPNLIDSEEKWDKVEWPSIDICQRYYEEMRGNVVQLEMQWEEMREAKATTAGEETAPLKMKSPKQGNDSIDALPQHIIPTQRTYELLIKGFAWRGDLLKAAKILYEMTQTPVDSMKRMLMMKKGKMVGVENELDSITFKASISTYDAFFRGFCKHSIPSNLIYYDTTNPDQCHWDNIEGDGKASSDWNINSLVKIFESFLELKSEDCQQAANGYASPEMKGRGKASISISDDVPIDPWLLDQGEEMIDNWSSIISLQDPIDGRGEIHRAPTTQQLFNILTALRRTSNDNPLWVLDQWQRIESKFGSPGEGPGYRPKTARTVNKQGWTDWTVDARLERVLEHLKSRL